MIRCPCGAEILLLPNAKLMGTAIEAHVEEHKRKLKGRRDAEAEADRIADDLIMQVLSSACEI